MRKPCVALHHRTERTVLDFCHLHTKIDAVDEIEVGHKLSGQFRLVDRHLLIFIGKYATSSSHLVCVKRRTQAKIQHREFVLKEGLREIPRVGINREVRRSTVGVVRSGLRRRIVIIELESQLVSNVPEEVQAKKIVLIEEAIAARSGTQISTHRVLAVRQLNPFVASCRNQPKLAQIFVGFKIALEVLEGHVPTIRRDLGGADISQRRKLVQGW